MFSSALLRAPLLCLLEFSGLYVYLVHLENRSSLFLKKWKCFDAIRYKAFLFLVPKWNPVNVLWNEMVTDMLTSSSVLTTFSRLFLITVAFGRRPLIKYKAFLNVILHCWSQRWGTEKWPRMFWCHKFTLCKKPLSIR